LARQAGLGPTLHTLFVRLLVLLLLLSGAALALHTGPSHPVPTVSDGVVDLRGWRVERDGPVPLAGAWRFEPGRFVPPDAASASSLSTVPGGWDRARSAMQGPPPAWGSYLLTVQCDRAEGMALLTPWQPSAAHWYVNGVLVHRQGRPASTADQERAAMGTRVVSLTPAGSCPMQVVVHVSNFQMARGGIVFAPQAGDERVLNLARGRALALDFGLAGLCLIFGSLSLAFYSVRRRDRSGLWFGLLCASATIYTGFANEQIFERLGLNLPMGVHLRVQYLAWFACVPPLLLFVRKLFPQEFKRPVTRWLLWGCAVPPLLVLGLPMPQLSAALPLLQWWTVACVAWLLAGLADATLRRQDGALAFLVGLLPLGALLLADAVQLGERFQWQRMPLGLLGFMLAATAAMLQRFARALTMEELRGLEQRHRVNLLVRATRAGIVDWDATSGKVSYSERYKEMRALPADADTARWPPFWAQVHQDDRERVRTAFLAHLRDATPHDGTREYPAMEFRLLRADGGVVWVHAEGIGLIGNDGRTLRYVSALVDTTRFHQQEQALRTQVELTRTEQRRLDLVVRGARVGIVDWDGVTHQTYYSPRFREMLGHPPDADTSDWPDYFRVLIHPEDRERVTRRWVAFIKGKGPEGPRGEYYSPEEYRLLRADGSHVWVQASGIAVRDEQGFVQRWIAAVIDVTERRAQEQALRDSHDQIAAQAELVERQNEALKESVKLREEMERIGRHDLKTPLNTIIAVPRLLRERLSLEPDDEELLGIVERAGLRILNLVNLSLDLFRMEQGSYAVRPQPVDLLAVLRTVVADVQPHAATKALTLQLQVAGVAAQPQDAVHAWAEELLCYSILANLMKNAIEAALEGSTITVDVQASEPLRLTLHNLGAVPEAVREGFFEKYTTAGKSDGTGLGTYSAWLMARIQGGELAMRTSEDEGTTLTLTLPKASAAQAQALQSRQAGELHASSAVGPALPPWCVLAVDDDEYNLLVMRRYLPAPLQVVTAVNGRAALEAAQQHRPDLVLIDLDMPVMDGLQATTRLRELQRQGRVPAARIVMLSSHDDEQTRERAVAAGCDHYLTKPVSKEVLLQTLQWAAGQRAQPPHPLPRADDPAAVVLDPDLLDRMPAFLQSRRQLIDELEGALGQGDEPGVRRHAHRLAGSFGLYGLHWAAGECRDIEQGTWDVAALPPRLEALRLHLDGVQSRTATMVEPAVAPG